MYARDQLGAWGAIGAAAADAFLKNKGGGASPGGASPGGASPGGAGSPSTTTVSPAFQQQFTPQISPVFQQTQDSPGATQAATTTQHAPGGQAARGGSSSAPGADFGAPGSGDFPASSVASPLPAYQDTFEYPDAVRDVMRNQPFDWTPVVWIGGFATVLLLGSMYFRGRRKR